MQGLRPRSPINRSKGVYRCATCCSFSPSSLALTPASAAYHMVRDVLANGGGRSVGAGHQIICTVGQLAIGPSEGGGYIVRSGFWYTPGEGISGIEVADETLPIQFGLVAATGNPLRACAGLRYDVPRRSRVTINLYDVSGRQVRGIVDNVVEPGRHRVDLDAMGLSAGIYFCRMEAETFRLTRRFVLIQ